MLGNALIPGQEKHSSLVEKSGESEEDDYGGSNTDDYESNAITAAILLGRPLARLKDWKSQYPISTSQHFMKELFKNKECKLIVD